MVGFAYSMIIGAFVLRTTAANPRNIRKYISIEVNSPQDSCNPHKMVIDVNIFKTTDTNKAPPITIGAGIASNKVGFTIINTKIPMKVQ